MLESKRNNSSLVYVQTKGIKVTLLVVVFFLIFIIILGSFFESDQPLNLLLIY